MLYGSHDMPLCGKLVLWDVNTEGRIRGDLGYEKQFLSYHSKKSHTMRHAMLVLTSYKSVPVVNR